MHIKSVTFLGSSQGKAGDAVYDGMTEIGYRLAAHVDTIQTGGYGGSGMEAPVVRSGNTRAVGYTLNCTDLVPNIYVEEVMCGERPGTGFGIRLENLLDTDAFVIGAGGKLGTLTEILAIINCTTKGFWEKPRPIAIFEPEAYPGPSWADVVASLLPLGLVSPATIQWLRDNTFGTPKGVVEHILNA